MVYSDAKPRCPTDARGRAAYIINVYNINKHNGALNYSHWKIISMMVSEINEKLDATLKSEDISLKQHLAGNVYLSVSKKFPFVDLRTFFHQKDQITPYATRRGAPCKRVVKIEQVHSPYREDTEDVQFHTMLSQ